MTRDVKGRLSEYKLPYKLPSLQGVSAEFILNQSIPKDSNKVIKLRELSQRSTLARHIFGGIQSSALNPFSNNQTNLTSADPSVYEVWLVKKKTTGLREEKLGGENPYSIKVYSNPFGKEFFFAFVTDKPVEYRYYISNTKGQCFLALKNCLAIREKTAHLSKCRQIKNRSFCLWSF